MSTKTHNIWCTVPKIWSKTDIIFCHFGLFFALLPLYGPRKSKFSKKMKKNPWEHYHFTHVYHKWQSYDVWSLRYWARWTEFFILNCFLPFYHPNNPKNQNLEKLKKASGDIIILHKCTKSLDHMLYCSLDMVRNRFNCYFSFWAIFWPFASLTTWKIKIKKKWKKCLETSFYNSVPKIMICYTVPEIWCVTDAIIFSFWAIFCLFTPLTAKKIKI